jgi:hypothetical protein
MLTGEVTTFVETPHEAAVRREFELAVRELELKRREAEIKKREFEGRLPRMPASYFSAGNNPTEDDWWEKQFGRRLG